ncbi:MAG: hypothetical protein LBU13_04715, partial [Synergistaceae bacterium]|nr:hypothetical protein [Synergistaceae bacterium]
TALTKYFGSRPAKSSVESTFGGSRKSFVWIVRNNNLNARIELFVIYDRRSLAPNSITRFLWRKREQISVSIFVENQYISNYTVSK